MECNIQYALDPATGDYRVIEVNARLSRSSALASMATGYPLAYVAAKIAQGYTLPRIRNCVTQTTTAFFEPALVYIVCKVPRWDFDKFPGMEHSIGPEMKSVGEVMAIGRSFPEVLQKSLRMLEIGVDGLDPTAPPCADVRAELANPSPRRMIRLAQAFHDGMTLEEAHALTRIDRFFLAEIAATKYAFVRQSIQAPTSPKTAANVNPNDRSPGSGASSVSLIAFPPAETAAANRNEFHESHYGRCRRCGLDMIH